MPGPCKPLASTLIACLQDLCLGRYSSAPLSIPLDISLKTSGAVTQPLRLKAKELLSIYRMVTLCFYKHQWSWRAEADNLLGM